jgi:hypothetical protein
MYIGVQHTHTDIYNPSMCSQRRTKQLAAAHCILRRNAFDEERRETTGAVGRRRLPAR